MLAEVVDKLRQSEVVGEPGLDFGTAGGVLCDFSPAERLCAQHRLAVEPVGPRSRSEEEEEEPAAWSGDWPLCEADPEKERWMDAQKVRRQVDLSRTFMIGGLRVLFMKHSVFHQIL